MGFFSAPERQITAVFSGDRKYRYLLNRYWDERLPTLPIVMHTPSTGDEEANDPTITRCIGFAQRWGFGGISIGNLHGMVTTDPTAILTAEEPFGPDNPLYLRSLIALALAKHTAILCAWGGMRCRDNVDLRFTRSVWAHKARAVCLGTTQDKHPRHPLYVGRLAPPVPFTL